MTVYNEAATDTRPDNDPDPAFTIEHLTDWHLYGTDEEIDEIFAAGLDRVWTHLRNHPPSPTRAAVAAEILCLSVEHQARLTPGVRLYLAAHPIPRTWWEES